MSDVWGAFGGGYDLGLQHRRRRRLGEAYQSGGLEAVETAAGEMGDLEAANYAGTMRRDARRFEDETTQRAYERMEKIRPYALGTIAELGRRPIGQRGAYLANPNVRRYFIDWGFTEDQLNSAAQTLDSENGDQFLQELRAGFTQHQNRDWTLTTLPTADGQGFEQRPIAINPETGDIDIGQGSIPAAPGEVEAFGNGGLWRRNPSAPGGYEVLREPRSGGGSGASYSILTPQEVQALGLPSGGTYQRNNVTGEVSTLGRQRGNYTNDAGLSAQFADRMSAAHQTLLTLESGFVSPQGVFLAQSGTGSQYERQARQAQREFVTAILRRESGAVISPSEFDSAAQQYFPQYGDGPEVIEQKRQARMRAIQGLINASQGAYEEWYGEGSGAERAAVVPRNIPYVDSAMRAGAIAGALGAGAGGGATLPPEMAGFVTAEEWQNMDENERATVRRLLGGGP